MDKHCTNCGASLNKGSKFCHNCATPVGGTPAPRRGSMVPWVVAVVTVAIAGTMAAKKIFPPVPPPTASLAPTPFSVPQTPKDLADQYFDTAMRAAESGDQQTVQTNSRNALNEYSRTTMDADTRFHMGLLHLNLRQTDSTMAQADSIAARDPNHLFAPMLRHRVAGVTGDDAAAAQALSDFSSKYQLENALGRREYQSHSRLVQDFAQLAGL